MKRRNHTAEIMREMFNGRVPVRSIGTPEPVKHQPRTPKDPQPWTDGMFRYSGREVHTVERCGKNLLSLYGGRFVHCDKPSDHTKACAVTGA